ncbi:MAG: CheR family methyltransferase [Pseudomonadota bacterium]
MKLSDFDLMTHLIREHSGLVIPRERVCALEHQLARAARRHSLRCAEEIGHALSAGSYRELLDALCDELALAPAGFMNPSDQMAQFREITLPYLIKHRAVEQKLRFWVVGCGRGQAAYSLAMVLKETSELADWQLEVHASDRSGRALAGAEAGEYTQSESQQGLPIGLQLKYLHQAGDAWQVKDKLKKLLRFSNIDLLEPEKVEAKGPFDAVFCRGLLGHLEGETRDHLLEHLNQMTATDGFLYLGEGEASGPLGQRLRVLPGWPGIYRPAGDQEPPALEQVAV